MRKKTIITLLLSVMLLSPGAGALPAFAAEETVNDKIELFTPEEFANREPTSILAFATDMHIAPDAETGAVNPLFPYNTGITAAMLNDVVLSGADALILCGDITNAGRMYQHEGLVSLLEPFRESGLPILVIPGNHDIDEVSTRDFARLYADYGFNDAFSRDSSSLSYSVQLADQFLLLLDTGGYNRNGLSAEMPKETLPWVREQLDYAKSAGLPVLVIGHYPLLTTAAGAFPEKEALTALLQEYGVQLYICGHMHGRNVSRLDGLTELVVDQTISYPCNYALLSRYGADELVYLPKTIDVSLWAEMNGIEDPFYLAFSVETEQLSAERCRKTVSDIVGNHEVDPQEFEQAADFYTQFQRVATKGRLYWDAAALMNGPGYGSFLRIAEGPNYYGWILRVMEKPSPYVAGFHIQGDSIRALMPEE